MRLWVSGFLPGRRRDRCAVLLSERLILSGRAVGSLDNRRNDVGWRKLGAAAARAGTSNAALSAATVRQMAIRKSAATRVDATTGGTPSSSYRLPG
jgi:hypothetical protein